MPPIGEAMRVNGFAGAALNAGEIESFVAQLIRLCDERALAQLFASLDDGLTVAVCWVDEESLVALVLW